MRVALYCRVSTEEQAKRGLSMGDQMDVLREYAASHGYTVAGEYQDPGTSARKRYTRRQGLIRLLEDAKDGRFQLVLFTKLDRWVRSVRDYYQVQDILEAAGVGWQTTEEDYETVTASGRFKVNIMLSVAQDEADRTSERIKFTFEQKRARGESTNGRAPLGYKIENGRPVVDEETALAAKDLFQAYIETRSMVATVKHLREAWDIDRAYISVQRYLSDPIYKGEYLGSEVPALVSQEDWDLVQSILGSRAPRNAQKNIYLFHGLLHCAECGRAMNSSVMHMHGKDYIYYRCPKQMVGACTHRHRVREDVLEEWLLTHILDAAEKYDLSLRSEKKGPDPRAKAERIKGKMEKLKDLYLSDLIDREVYARDYEALKQELSTIELERPSKPIDLDGLRDSLHLYQELERSGKKEFWTRTLKEIRATNEDEFFVELR